ncbi:MAG: hypothetical protein AAF438_07320 [Pseudomonadota bacterium]
MTQTFGPLRSMSPHQLQQAVKWIVYLLLLINFGRYIYDDWNRANHVLTESSKFLDWTREFATTIDLMAWFTLLFMFELETYILGDRQWKGWVAYTVRGLRIICIVMIAHTVYAFVVTILQLQPTVPLETNNLCKLDKEVSYVYNLRYEDVGVNNCAELSAGREFYWVGNDPVVSTLEGLELERDLAWADLAEVLIWLAVLFAIEAVVRLQDRGVSGGRLIMTLTRGKIALYGVLIGIGIYWASLSHWLYLWDELVWIAGFSAIEMNLKDWRTELIEEI